MGDPVTINLRHVARGLGVPLQQCQAVVELLDEGNTVPFITRYRKDQTGGLNEEQIRQIQTRLTKLRLLAERKQTILRSIESQGKLDERLAKQIRAAGTTKRLEDLYLPFKPKKQTLATVARSRGLEPLATEILSANPACTDLDDRAADFANPDRQVPTAAAALLGAGHILAEQLSERAELRQRLREIIQRTGKLISSRIGGEPKPAPADKVQAASAESHLVRPSQPSPADSAEPQPEDSGPKQPAADEQPDSSEFVEPPGPPEPVVEPVAGATPDGEEPNPPEREANSTAQATGEGGSSAEPPAAILSPTGGSGDGGEGNQHTLNATETNSIAAHPVTDRTVGPVTSTPPSSNMPEPRDQPSLKDPKPTARERKLAAKELKKKKAEQKKQKAFSDYFDYSEEIKKIPPHRVLAINRGERARVLRVKIEVDVEAMYRLVDELCVPADHPHAEFLRGCARDSLSRLVLPSLEREVRRELTERAEMHAVGVFAKNLRNLLLQPPVRDRRVLAVDPGFKSGCKLAALDQFGNVLAHGTIYLVGDPARRPLARQIVAGLINRFGLTVVAVGNGTACREAEDFFAEMLAGELKDQGVAYVIVNEAGASVYSTSRLGREEFPDYDATLRGAISIGRRLQDPLSELVKIDPANIGVGLYQHDVKAKHLRASLDEVVESCVNYVGVDVNTASPALLRYVSGLNQLTARRLYEHRLEHGPFQSREQLKEVPGFGEATFVQAAGFLKIASGNTPLDATWIHPESYELADRVMRKLGASTAELSNKGTVAKAAEQIPTVDVPQLAAEFQVGALLLEDILSQLARPGRDPREDLPAPVFKHGVIKLEDLSVGMELTGTVLNVVDFGAFVDIGMHDSGLVHVSQLADKFVRDPHDVIAVGDIVKVWVVDVDRERRRVSLTMIPPGTRRSQQRRDVKTEKEPSAEPAQRTGRQRKPRGKGPPRFKDKRPPKREQKPRRPPKPVVPITEEMKAGKEPMRSFSDLAQFFQAKDGLAVGEESKGTTPQPKGTRRTAATKPPTENAATDDHPSRPTAPVPDQPAQEERCAADGDLQQAGDQAHVPHDEAQNTNHP